MKIFTFLSLSVILTVTAEAQINQGQFLAGGNISFTSIKNEGTNVAGYKTSNFFFSPNIGYFVIPKLAAGLRADIRTYKQNTPVSFKQTNISLSPFVRYYLLPVKQRFNVLADVGYIHYRSKYYNQPSSAYIQKWNGFKISAGPAFFLNEHVALEFLLGFEQTKVKNDYDNKSSTFNTGLGLQIHLGKIKTKSEK